MINRRTIIAGAAALASRPLLAQSSPSSLDRVKQSNKLRIGVAVAEPWFSKDPMSGQWSGVGVRMGKQFADDLGVELVTVETTWANAIAALQAAQIDVMLVLDPTEERRKAIDFPAAPLCYYALGALVKADSAAKVWSDFDKPDVRLGVTLGTSVDRAVSEMCKTASISRFATNDEAVAAFAARRVDAVAQFHPALVVQFARVRMGKVIIPTPINPVASSAGVRKETDTTFVDWLSERFAANYKAGKPQEFFAEYLKSKNIDPTSIPGLIKEQWS